MQLDVLTSQSVIYHIKLKIYMVDVDVFIVFETLKALMMQLFVIRIFECNLKSVLLIKLLDRINKLMYILLGILFGFGLVSCLLYVDSTSDQILFFHPVRAKKYWSDSQIQYIR